MNQAVMKSMVHVWTMIWFVAIIWGAFVSDLNCCLGDGNWDSDAKDRKKKISKNGELLNNLINGKEGSSSRTVSKPNEFKIST